MITEILRDLSIVIACGTAIYGIDSWRREHRGKKQIELAEQTLAAFYEASDAIRSIRNPISFGGETKDIERAPGESDAKYEARKRANLVFVRYQHHQELFNKIHSMRYQFMAQFGRESAEPFDELRKTVNRIFSAARMLAILWAREHFRNDEQLEKHWEQIGTHEAIFYDGLADEDPINIEIDSITSRIEATCKAIITGKGTLYHFLNIDLSKIFRK
jgi:hypothetical protein